MTSLSQLLDAMQSEFYRLRAGDMPPDVRRFCGKHMVDRAIQHLKSRTRGGGRRSQPVKDALWYLQAASAQIGGEILHHDLRIP